MPQCASPVATAVPALTVPPSLAPSPRCLQARYRTRSSAKLQHQRVYAPSQASAGQVPVATPRSGIRIEFLGEDCRFAHNRSTAHAQACAPPLAASASCRHKSVKILSCLSPVSSLVAGDSQNAIIRLACRFACNAASLGIGARRGNSALRSEKRRQVDRAKRGFMLCPRIPLPAGQVPALSMES
jgi:hypothetical protein